MAKSYHPGPAAALVRRTTIYFNSLQMHTCLVCVRALCKMKPNQTVATPRSQSPLIPRCHRAQRRDCDSPCEHALLEQKHDAAFFYSRLGRPNNQFSGSNSNHVIQCRQGCSPQTVRHVLLGPMSFLLHRHRRLGHTCMLTEYDPPLSSQKRFRAARYLAKQTRALSI